MSVKPVTPLPAATLVLLRDTNPGVEVLLMQRHRASKFAGGDYVFPGGKIERDDNPEDAAAWCAGMDPQRAAERIGLAGDPKTALGNWIGAIAPARMDSGLAAAINAGIVKAASTPTARERLAALGFEPAPASLPEELERSVRADRSRNAAIVKAFNITFD